MHVCANSSGRSFMHGYVGVSMCGQHCGNRIRPRHTIHTKTLLVKTTQTFTAQQIFRLHGKITEFHIIFYLQGKKPI